MGGFGWPLDRTCGGRPRAGRAEKFAQLHQIRKVFGGMQPFPKAPLSLVLPLAVAADALKRGGDAM
jgi:hypothetical protein